VEGEKRSPVFGGEFAGFGGMSLGGRRCFFSSFPALSNLPGDIIGDATGGLES
jgi:hypothetical protein